MTHHSVTEHKEWYMDDLTSKKIDKPEYMISLSYEYHRWSMRRTRKGLHFETIENCMKFLAREMQEYRICAINISADWGADEIKELFTKAFLEGKK